MLNQAQIESNVCFLETIGRVSGKRHEIEIWFASETGRSVLLMSGGREAADWVRNLRANPSCRIRFGSQWFHGIAREVEGTTEEVPVREALAGKYYGWRGGPLPNEWSRTSLPVVIDLIE